MNFNGISEFVSVAELESFTKAAQRIQQSTAHVSRSISALEQRLNIKLLYRTTRKVSLTQEGKLFYQHCRSILDSLDEAEQVVTQLQRKPKGKIKLTAPVTYGEQRILPLVNDFLAIHQDIEISAHITNQQIDLVEQGYDLAIRLGHLPDSTLMAKKLGQRKHYLCAAPSYIDKFGQPHSISELKNHNCLLGTLDYWRFKSNTGEKTIRVKGSIQYNSGISLVDAALKGLGLVQLPDYYVEAYIQRGQLVSLLAQHQEPDDGIWAIYPQNRHLSPKIRALVDYLDHHLSS